MAADRITRQMMGTGATVQDSTPDNVVRLYDNRAGDFFFASSFSGDGRGLFGGYNDPVANRILRSPVDDKTHLFYGDSRMSGLFTAGKRPDPRITVYAPDIHNRPGQRYPVQGPGGIVSSSNGYQARATLGSYSHIKLAINNDEVMLSTANFGGNAYTVQNNVDLTFSRARNPEIHAEANRISRWMVGNDQAMPKDLKHFMLAGKGQGGGIKEQILADIANAKKSITVGVAKLEDPQVLDALSLAAKRGVSVDVTLSTSDYHGQNAGGTGEMAENGRALNNLKLAGAKIRVSDKLMHANAAVIDDTVLVGDTRWNKMLAGEAASVTLRVKGDTDLKNKVQAWIRSKGREVQQGGARELGPFNSFLEFLAPRAPAAGRPKTRYTINPEVFLDSLTYAKKHGVDLEMLNRVERQPGMTENIARALVYDQYGTWDYKERLGVKKMEALTAFDRAMQSPTLGQGAMSWMFGGGVQEGSRGIVESWLIHGARALDDSAYAAYPAHLRPKKDKNGGMLEGFTNMMYGTAKAMLLSMAGFTFVGQPMMYASARFMSAVHNILGASENRFAKSLKVTLENVDNSMKLVTGSILKDVMAPRLRFVGPFSEIIDSAANVFLEKAPGADAKAEFKTFAGLMYNVNATLSEATINSPGTAVLDRGMTKHWITRPLSSEGIGSLFRHLNPETVLRKTDALGKMVRGAWRTFRPTEETIRLRQDLHADLAQGPAGWRAAPSESIQDFEEWLQRFAARGQISDEKMKLYLDQAKAEGHPFAAYDDARASFLSFDHPTSHPGSQIFKSGFRGFFNLNETAKILGKHKGLPRFSDFKKPGWVGLGMLVLGDFLVGQMASLGATTPFQQAEVESILNGIQTGPTARQVRVESRMGWGSGAWGALTFLPNLGYRMFKNAQSYFAGDTRYRDQTMAPGMYSAVMLRGRAGQMGQALGAEEARFRDDPIARLRHLSAPQNREQALLDMKVMLTDAMTINAMDHTDTTREITSMALQFAPISRLMTLTAASSNLGDRKMQFSLTLQGPVAMKMGYSLSSPFAYDPARTAVDFNSAPQGLFSNGSFPMLNPANYSYVPGSSGEALVHLSTDLLALRAGGWAIKTTAEGVGRLVGEKGLGQALGQSKPYVFGRTAYQWAGSLPGMAGGAAKTVLSKGLSGGKWGLIASVLGATMLNMTGSVVLNQGMPSAEELEQNVTSGLMVGTALTALTFFKGRDWAVRDMLTRKGTVMNRLLNYAAGKEVSLVTAQSAHGVVAVDTELERADEFRKMTQVDFTKSAKDAGVKGFLRRNAYEFVRAKVYAAPTPRMSSLRAASGKVALVALSVAAVAAGTSRFYTGLTHDDRPYHAVKEGLRALPGGSVLSGWWQQYQGFEARRYEDFSGNTNMDMEPSLQGNREKGYTMASVGNTIWRNIKNAGFYFGASDPFASSGSQGITWEFDQGGRMRWSAYFVQGAFGPFQAGTATKLAVTSSNDMQKDYYSILNMLNAEGLQGAYESRLRMVKGSASMGKLFHRQAALGSLGASGKAEIARRSAMSRWILGNNMGSDWLKYKHISRSKDATGRLHENNALYNAPGAIYKQYQAIKQFYQTGRTGLEQGALLDVASNYTELPEYDTTVLQQRRNSLDELAAVTGSDFYSGFSQQSFLDNKALQYFMTLSAGSGLMVAAGVAAHHFYTRPEGQSLADAVMETKMLGRDALVQTPKSYLLSSVAITPTNADGTVFRYEEAPTGLSKGRLHNTKNAMWIYRIGQTNYKHVTQQALFADPLAGVDSAPLRGRYSLRELLRGSSDTGRSLHRFVQKDALLRMARNPFVGHAVTERQLFGSLQKMIQSRDFLTAHNNGIQDILSLKANYGEFMETVKALDDNLTTGIESMLRAADNTRSSMSLMTQDVDGLRAALGGAAYDRKMAGLAQLAEQYGDRNNGLIGDSVDWQTRYRLQTVGFDRAQGYFNELDNLMADVRKVTGIAGDVEIVELLRGENTLGLSVEPEKLSAFQAKFRTLDDNIRGITSRMQMGSVWAGQEAEKLIAARGFKVDNDSNLKFYRMGAWIIRADNSMRAWATKQVSTNSSNMTLAKDWLEDSAIARAEQNLENFLDGKLDLNGNEVKVQQVADNLRAEWASWRLSTGGGAAGDILPEDMPEWHALEDMWANPGEAPTLRKELLQHLTTLEGSMASNSLFSMRSAKLLVQMAKSGELNIGWGAAKLGLKGAAMGFLGVTQFTLPITGLGSASYLAAVSYTGELNERESAMARRDSNRILADYSAQAVTFGAVTAGGALMLRGTDRIFGTSAHLARAEQTAELGRKFTEATGRSMTRVERMAAVVGRQYALFGRLMSWVAKGLPALAGIAGASSMARGVALAGATGLGAVAAGDAFIMGAASGAAMGAPLGPYGAAAGAIMLGTTSAMATLATRDLLMSMVLSGGLMALGLMTGGTEKLAQYFGSYVPSKIEDYAKASKPGSISYAMMTGYASITEGFEGIKQWLTAGADAEAAKYHAQTGQEVSFSNNFWLSARRALGYIMPGLDRSTESMNNLIAPIAGRMSLSNNPDAWLLPDGTPKLELANLFPWFHGSVYDHTIKNVRGQEALMKTSDASQVVASMVSNESLGIAPYQPAGPLRDAPYHRNSLTSLFTSRLERPTEAMNFQYREKALWTQHVYRRLLDRRDDFGNRIENQSNDIGYSGYGGPEASNIARPWQFARVKPEIQERYRTSRREDEPQQQPTEGSPMGTGLMAGGALTIARSIITSAFGPRRAPIRGASTFHKGVDIGWGHGTGVQFDTKGLGEARVTHAGWLQGYGNSVQMTLADGRTVFFAHLSQLNVQLGQTFNNGVVNVGRVGNTGLPGMAAHLHFETGLHGAQVNPLSGSTVDLTRRVRGGTPIFSSIQHHDHDAEHRHSARDQAQRRPAPVGQGVMRWMPRLETATRGTGVRATLLAALMQKESGGDPNAIAYATTGYGRATGLFQFTVGTASDNGFGNLPAVGTAAYHNTAKSVAALGADERLNSDKQIATMTRILKRWTAAWGESAALGAHFQGPGGRTNAAARAYAAHVLRMEQDIIHQIQIAKAKDASRRDVRTPVRPKPAGVLTRTMPGGRVLTIQMADPSSGGQRESHAVEHDRSNRESRR